MKDTRHLLSWDNGKGRADTTIDDYNDSIEDYLDTVRETVKRLGDYDEGGFEQAQEIVAGLSVDVELLVRAVFTKYPEIQERADKGEI